MLTDCGKSDELELQVMVVMCISYREIWMTQVDGGAKNGTWDVSRVHHSPSLIVFTHNLLVSYHC